MHLTHSKNKEFSRNFVSQTSSITHLNNLLDYIQAKLHTSALEADHKEVIEKSNIHNYEFDRKKLKPKALKFIDGSSLIIEQKLIKIISRIDFLDIGFKTIKQTHRSYIKKFLTEKIGKKHFITDELEINMNKVGLTSNIFNIRIHDVNNKDDIQKIIIALETNYGAHDFKITCIELAHDFYHASPEFLIALFKSVQLDPDIHNIRVFRLKGENKSIPYDPIQLKHLFLNGFNIGVNDYRKDDLYYHFYIKKTDQNKLPLP